MAYVLGHAGASFIVAQDQEQVDKMLSIADRLPRSTRIALRRAAGACATTTTRASHSLDDVDRSAAEAPAPIPRRAARSTRRSTPAAAPTLA